MFFNAMWVSSGYRRFSPGLLVSLVAALVLRLIVVVLANGHTPHDVAVYFAEAGQAVLNGQNPVEPPQWNFLPTMPFAFAAESKLGLPWEIAGKLLPVAADLVTIALIHKLTPHDRANRASWQYAIHPLPLFIVAWHGQVEPVAVALGLGALLLARKSRPGAAGALLGLAITTKTWPVVFIPGLLREAKPPQWIRVGLGAAAVIAAVFATLPLFLHSSVAATARVLASYRSFIGDWGWTGIGRVSGLDIGRGYGGVNIEPYQRIGTVLLITIVVALTVRLWREADGIKLTAALMLGFLAVTAGFGPQYLLWPAALLIISGGWRIWPYMSLSAGYAAYFYLIAYPNPGDHLANQLLVLASVPVIAAAVLALPSPRDFETQAVTAPPQAVPRTSDSELSAQRPG